MLQRGVYPASVTPMTSDGLRLDTASLAALLKRFEAANCKGVVLAGTNGEGSSLSDGEKLELLSAARELSPLDYVMGIGTSSATSAAELCAAAAARGAIAGLVLPPSYFKDVTEEGLAVWFERVLDLSPAPLLVYNFPQRTGIVLSANLLGRLAAHPRCAGAKDSSGDPHNLGTYARAMPGKHLYVGDETLLLAALEAGWSGSISGAANLYAAELVDVVGRFDSGSHEGAAKAFAALLPRLHELRSRRQPATNKARLYAAGVLATASVRAPLTPEPV